MYNCIWSSQFYYYLTRFVTYQKSDESESNTSRFFLLQYVSNCIQNRKTHHFRSLWKQMTASSTACRRRLEIWLMMTLSLIRTKSFEVIVRIQGLLTTLVKFRYRDNESYVKAFMPEFSTSIYFIIIPTESHLWVVPGTRITWVNFDNRVYKEKHNRVWNCPKIVNTLSYQPGRYFNLKMTELSGWLG